MEACYAWRGHGSLERPRSGGEHLEDDRGEHAKQGLEEGPGPDLNMKTNCPKISQNPALCTATCAVAAANWFLDAFGDSQILARLACRPTGRTARYAHVQLTPPRYSTALEVSDSQAHAREIDRLAGLGLSAHRATFEKVGRHSLDGLYINSHRFYLLISQRAHEKKDSSLGSEQVQRGILVKREEEARALIFVLFFCLLMIEYHNKK